MIDLTDEEWDALEGWREAAEENARDMMSHDDESQVEWAVSQRGPLPDDVDPEAARGLAYWLDLKRRIANHDVTLEDLDALQHYGEAVSLDETAEESVDRRAWEKVVDVTRGAFPCDVCRTLVPVGDSVGHGDGYLCTDCFGDRYHGNPRRGGILRGIASAALATVGVGALVLGEKLRRK